MSKQFGAKEEAAKAPKPPKVVHDGRPIGGEGGNSTRNRKGGKPQRKFP